jgi:hypothetical protein
MAAKARSGWGGNKNEERQRARPLVSTQKIKQKCGGEMGAKELNQRLAEFSANKNIELFFMLLCAPQKPLIFFQTYN